MRDWSVFVAYSGLHLATVLACFALIAAVAYAGCNSTTECAEWRLRRAIVWCGLSVWVIYNTAWNWHGIDVHEGLPLQLCDVGGVVAPLALLTLNRWLRATLYFWAVTLTAQAYIQPTVTQGPTNLLFWCFWIAHTVIVGSAVYDLVVLRFRPQWGDLKRAYAASVAYLAVVVPVNVLLGSNYGYVGNPPAGHSIPPFVNLLGPWPGRAVILVALAGLGFMLALAPWMVRLGDWRSRTASSETSA
jgi:hypothetical integral membrane protein (TIGR02206 family)